MTRNSYVESLVQASLYMDNFMNYFSFLEALWRFIFAGRVEVLNHQVLHVRIQIRVSPGDPLVVSNGDEGQARQAESLDVKTAGVQMDLIPRTGKLVWKMHVIGE